MNDGRLHFVKMSGAGNDFIVLGPESIARLPQPVEPWVRRLCIRGLSVGADGLLLVEPGSGDGRVKVTFHNPDGSNAFCGNGSRCAARFAAREGLAGSGMVLESCAGPVPAEVDGERVAIRLPLPVDHGTSVLEIGERRLELHHVEAGTGHAISWVEEPARAPLELWGPTVRSHPRFAPAGVNFNLASLAGRRLRLRTWEKGVERETLACGSGAIAAAFAARSRGAGEALTVEPESGIPLEVRFDAESSRLAGDARIVYEGRLDAEAIRY